MRALITGVPGWLGSRFLEVLVRGFKSEGPLNDWKLRVMVEPGREASFVESLMRFKEIEMVRADVTRKDTLKEAVEDVDCVFHIVGLIHPRKIDELYLINTIGTQNLLKAAAEAEVKRFVYVSSNSPAGTNEYQHRLMTEDDPPRPYMNYGLSKYYAECIVNNFYEEGNIETVILRPCWFYGPHQPRRQTKFFTMIMKGNPILFGRGFNLRSMSYVDNTCEGILLAQSVKQANGQTYWIADARPYTTLEIYQTVAELLEVKNFKPRCLPGFSSEVFLFADEMLQGLGLYQTEIHVAGEMNKSIACSIQKARKELGYNPKIDLREGMRRSIEWCRKEGLL